MTDINKGKVSNILDGGSSVTVTPYAGGIVSSQLTVPFFLIGTLPIGTPVAYVIFDDGTGIILGRMDGKGNNFGGGDS